MLSREALLRPASQQPPWIPGLRHFGAQAWSRTAHLFSGLVASLKNHSYPSTEDILERSRFISIFPGPVKQPGPTAQPGDSRSAGRQQGPGQDRSRRPRSLGAPAREGDTRSTRAQRTWGSKRTAKQAAVPTICACTDLVTGPAAPHQCVHTAARRVTFIRPSRDCTQTAAPRPAGASALSSQKAGLEVQGRRPGLCPTQRGERCARSRRQEGTGSGRPAATERSRASCKLSQAVEGAKPSSTRSRERRCHRGTITDRAGRALGRRGGRWELLTCGQARSPCTSSSPLGTCL